MAVLIFAHTEGVKNFLELTGGTSSRLHNITSDSSGNLYVTGSADAGGGNVDDGYIAKITSSNSIAWQRIIYTNGADVHKGIALDSSDNVYTTGFVNGSGNYHMHLAKYNNSGALQWQREFGPSNSYAQGVAVDGADNAYIVGTSSAVHGNTDMVVAKYNSSGVIQWQKAVGSSDADVAYGITADQTTNDVFITGYVNNGTGGSNTYNDMCVAKLDSSGNIQWSREIRPFPAGADDGWAITHDGTYIYAVGDVTWSGNFNTVILKYDYSGNIQWQREFDHTSNIRGYAIAVNGSDVYISGFVSDSGSKAFVAKLTTAGAVSWQGNISGITQLNGVAMVNNTPVFAGGGNINAFICRLDPNQNDLGTNGAFTYSSTSYTFQTSTYPEGSASLASSTSSLTDSAGTLTDAAGSLTLTSY